MAHFRTPEEAWFFLLREIRKGEPKGAALDVFKAVERLFQRQRLSLEEIQCLNKWGQNRMVPDAFYHGERRLWLGAMRLIEQELRERRIIE